MNRRLPLTARQLAQEADLPRQPVLEAELVLLGIEHRQDDRVARFFERCEVSEDRFEALLFAVRSAVFRR
jgi:hypothetical protein